MVIPSIESTVLAEALVDRALGDGLLCKNHSNLEALRARLADALDRSFADGVEARKTWCRIERMHGRMQLENERKLKDDVSG